ncbi:T9SS type A sorting domain-containing protein [Flavobacterium antarcticum]|uniref:T9SS type A sorting domain-containing protein n=1 Tax=Flavobacterium antarcticum TaxID=271155 RepID=UPI0003B691D1|nr:T9SS type A sorting domain-containing protein [Flavobacterium antarcticum]
MKKNLLLLLLLCLSFTAIDSNAQAPTTLWADNATTMWYNGTSTNFTITSANELAGVAILVEGGNNFAGKTITIANDLDLGAHLWKPIGKNTTFTFSGTVEGNNFAISNLFVTNTATSFTGLFGQITSATIKNIKLVNPTISAKDDAGTIAGGLLNASLVLNCHATGVVISGTGANIGGLVGSLLGDSTISKSSSNGQVSGLQQIGGIVGSPYNKATISECFSGGTVSGLIHVGGIAGYSAFAFTPNRTILVDNCYSRANLVCTNGPVGGIFGGSSALLVVQNSYATGLITSSGTIGGVLGGMGAVTATNNYWDIESSGASEAVAEWAGAPGTVDITGKTTAEMKMAELVTLLNQNQTGTPWTIDANVNDGYPILASSLLQNNSFTTVKSTVLVYPTMTADFVNISSAVNLTNATVYSISGSLVKSQSLHGLENTIDLSGIISGVYFLNIQTENGSSTHKIIKK